MYSGRHWDDVLYKDESLLCLENLPQLEIKIFLSNQNSLGDLSDSRRVAFRYQNHFQIYFWSKSSLRFSKGNKESQTNRVILHELNISLESEEYQMHPSLNSTIVKQFRIYAVLRQWATRSAPGSTTQRSTTRNGGEIIKRKPWM